VDLEVGIYVFFFRVKKRMVKKRRKTRLADRWNRMHARSINSFDVHAHVDQVDENVCARER
jgi:hypothetical protein